jgi:NAD(P)H-flavin reductase
MPDPLSSLTYGLLSLTAVLSATVFVSGGPEPFVVSLVSWWFNGKDTVLVRKTTLVYGTDDGSRLPVHTLTFRLPGGPGTRRIGARMDLGDTLKVVVPGYKPKSYSMSAEDPEAGTFDITFKVYPNGRASGYLDRLRVGDVCRIFHMGPYERQQPPPPTTSAVPPLPPIFHVRHVGIIALGVGITEAIPIARAELARGGGEATKGAGRVHVAGGVAASASVERDGGTREGEGEGEGEGHGGVTKVTLLWASRTKADTFWDAEINALVKEGRDRFRVVRMYSKEPRGAGSAAGSSSAVLHGRVSADVIRTVFEGTWKEEGGSGEGGGGRHHFNRAATRFVTVGTKAMMKDLDAMLGSAGFPMPAHALLKARNKVAKVLQLARLL